MLFIKTVILLFISSLLLVAGDISDKTIESIASDPTWLRLLHYDQAKEKSYIKDKSFFLSNKGEYSPKKELIATLEGYKNPFFPDTNNTTHPQCRYPARYYWLSQKIDFPDYKIVNSNCKKLINWELLQGVDSVSLIFVSGYLGNPASAFGHSFIKINRSKNRDENLFDTTISYGALLPPQYSMPSYIYNGLVGGYDAAYTDKYFYNQDITYSNQEFRDMWEYRLNTSEEQKTLFLLHIWELMGKKFQYFFLNRNCGYRVSELLELVYNHQFIDHAKTWYAPMESFYKLQEIGEENNISLVDTITYIPSKQQKIYAHFKRFDSLVEQDIIEEMIDRELKSVPTDRGVDPDQQAKILDFVIAYHKYRISQDEKESISKEDEAFSRALILNRFRLPMAKKRVSKISEKMEITKSNRLSHLGVSILREQQSESLGFHYAPFSIERDGFNSFGGDEMVLLESRLNISSDKLDLESLDLIRIQRLKTQQLPFEEQNPFSWNLQIGTQNYRGRDYFIDGGVGLAWEIGERLKLYSMINLSAHTEDEPLRYRPNIGVHLNIDRFASTAIWSYEEDFNQVERERGIELSGQYSLKDDLSLFVEYKKRNQEKFELGLKWFY